MHSLPSSMPSLPAHSGSRGFSLIELLVSLALGLFLMGGVISIFVSNQQSFKDNEGLARIQENTRFAFEQLSREVRDAGAIPCGVRTINNVVRIGGITPTSVPWWSDWNAGTIRIHDSSVASTVVAFGTTPRARVAGTDAVTVLRASMTDNFLRTVQAHNAAGGQITLANTSNYSAGDLVLICDGFSGAIFEASIVNATTINYDTISPSQNCSISLGWAPGVDCATNAVIKQFAPGSYITKLDPAFWYIGVSVDGQSRSLFRESVTNSSLTTPATVGVQRLEMVPNVSNLQIEYLMRIRNPPATPGSDPTFTLATQWENDEGVTKQFTLGWGENQPRQVRAARLTLSFDSNVVNAEGVTNADGSNVLQRESIAVVSIRNREIAK
jgi:type IV pilus assembly protein PilW